MMAIVMVIILLLIGDIPEIRIGTDEDLEDCQGLLNEFMPAHVKSRKFLQKLYLKLDITTVTSAR